MTYKLNSLMYGFISVFLLLIIGCQAGQDINTSISANNLTDLPREAKDSSEGLNESFSDWNPVWSPDGQYIAFQSGRAGNYDIWRVDLTGTEIINLTANRPLADGIPNWSPDGTHIMFLSYAATVLPELPALDIWIMDADGTSQVNLTPEFSASVSSAAWSPTGKHIVFGTGGGNIWIMNADGSDKLNLTESDDFYFELPTWSPDGRALGVELSEVGLWVMELDYSNLSAPAVSAIASGVYYSILWSPTSNLIATTTKNDNDLYELWIIDTDSLETTKLVSDTTMFRPVWSPDGKTIISSKRRNGIPLMLIDVASLGSVTLTLGDDASIDFPAWSPDGTQIAFASDKDGSVNIWVMDANGSNPVNLTGQYRDD